MKQQEKNIEVIKHFLTENNLRYKENLAYRGHVMDICIPQVMIAIHVGDDQEFFNAVKKYYAPFFVREEESEVKTLEKITNCCIMQMKRMHGQMERSKTKKRK